MDTAGHHRRGRITAANYGFLYVPGLDTAGKPVCTNIEQLLPHATGICGGFLLVDLTLCRSFLE
jgi:hypothetical protein